MVSTDCSDPRSIRIEDFDYPLEEGRIATHPLAERDQCKLLVRAKDGRIATHNFSELPGLLPDNTILIYNDTRVINARLRFKKTTGAIIEIFCLEPSFPTDYVTAFACTEKCEWLCFVGNSKRWKDGDLTMELEIDDKIVELHAERTGREGNASIIKFRWDKNADITFSQIIEAAGEIPIPPYLKRDTEQTDITDYQTVYSTTEGSVAAPTAGLHFTDKVLADIDALGISRRAVTLHVGAGTFQPVKSDTIADHEMHREFIAADRSLIAELANSDKKVIAVGTTSVRTLESLYHLGCMIANGETLDCVGQWYPYLPDHPNLTTGEAFTALLNYLDYKGLDKLIASTRVIIAPGYRYRVVKGMVTNFHQPRSTLLLLVSAFVEGKWREIYDYALEHDYRFLSYGDACLLL